MLTKLVRISLPKKLRKLRLDDADEDDEEEDDDDELFAFDLLGESVNLRLLRADGFFIC